jgi:4-hydroxybenzoyl-CoA thioesterase
VAVVASTARATPPTNAPEARPDMLTNRRTLTVEWGDCDAAGIVYFPRYFEWFDACTAALFRRAGLEKHALIETFGIVGYPVVDTRARFILASTFGDTVDVDTTISRWGRSSFDVQHRLLRGSDLAVEGFETRVWTVRAAGEPRRLESHPIPAEVIERFSRA